MTQAATPANIKIPFIYSLTAQKKKTTAIRIKNDPQIHKPILLAHVLYIFLLLISLWFFCISFFELFIFSPQLKQTIPSFTSDPQFGHLIMIPPKQKMWTQPRSRPLQNVSWLNYHKQPICMDIIIYLRDCRSRYPY